MFLLLSSFLKVCQVVYRKVFKGTAKKILIWFSKRISQLHLQKSFSISKVHFQFPETIFKTWFWFSISKHHFNVICNFKVFWKLFSVPLVWTYRIERKLRIHHHRRAISWTDKKVQITKVNQFGYKTMWS